MARISAAEQQEAAEDAALDLYDKILDRRMILAKTALCISMTAMVIAVSVLVVVIITGGQGIQI